MTIYRKQAAAAAAGGIIVLLLILAGWALARPRTHWVEGQVEATQIDVSPKVPGRVAAVLVREGDQVQAGQLLARLDAPEIEAKLRQADAVRDAARSLSAKAEHGARPEEIRAARSNWERAEAAAVLAEKTDARIARLFADGVVPLQKRDEAEAQARAARDAADAARALYDQARTGARPEDRAAAAAQLRQAEGAVAEAEAYRDAAVLRAPTAGEVVERVVDPGELVSPGVPVLSLVDLSDSWVTFNLREDQLAGLRIGTELPVRFPALGQRVIRLRVTYMSPLGEFATWRATQESGGYDLRTFEVRARPARPVPGLRPGMSALLQLAGGRGAR